MPEPTVDHMIIVVLIVEEKISVSEEMPFQKEKKEEDYENGLETEEGFG